MPFSKTETLSNTELRRHNRKLASFCKAELRSTFATLLRSHSSHGLVTMYQHANKRLPTFKETKLLQITTEQSKYKPARHLLYLLPSTLHHRSHSLISRTHSNSQECTYNFPISHEHLLATDRHHFAPHASTDARALLTLLHRL